MTQHNDKQLGLSPIKRRLINSSLAIDANTPKNVIYQHSVICQTSLPYRNPGDDVRFWEQQQGAAILRIKAGEAFHSESQAFFELGLPYGPKPRIILAYLNAEAVKCQSPVIDVATSLTAFTKRLGLSCNGRDIHTIKEQLSKLSSSTITLGLVQDNRAIQVNTQLVKSFDLMMFKKPNQRVFWPSIIQLSDDYFNNLMNHAVPLDERAIAALSHSAIGLDIYAWLAQRLHRVPKGKPQFIAWPRLMEQFGRGYNRLDNFKSKFRQILNQVYTQYTVAKIKLDGRGMTLHNSPPPIKGCITTFDTRKS